VFVTQFVFVWGRTLNVQAISRGNIAITLLTGALIHITWLVGIAIGANSVYKILNNYDVTYLSIVACSLSGGLLGSYLGMKKGTK
jgi:uncharacterized membrane protein